MCRILGYLGLPIGLDQLLYKPEHSLIVQSYQPQEMNSGVVNADGFGIGWYHPHRQTNPFTYKHLLPIWSDLNLPQLSRYIESGCVVANVRSATGGQATDLSNCHPFSYKELLFTHNGAIQNFRQSLYRPIRDRLDDESYQSIDGSTDSEHIFALLIHYWQHQQYNNLEKALQATLMTLTELAEAHDVGFSATLLVTDGDRLVACRYAHRVSVPSLYWLRDDPVLPDAAIVASEPLFLGNWVCCPENSIITVGKDLDIQFHQLSP